MFLPGADELRGLVDERDKVLVLDGVATVSRGCREARGPRRPRSKELPALPGGRGPDVAEGLREEAPRGRHGGGKLRRRDVARGLFVGSDHRGKHDVKSGGRSSGC